jgi:hypothetical protein
MNGSSRSKVTADSGLTQPDKYGIKIWLLSCSEIYYVKNFDVYLGKVKNRGVNQASRVVLQLCQCLDQGFNVTTDNFFTSLPLAKQLLDKKITLFGISPSSLMFVNNTRLWFFCLRLFTTSLTKDEKKKPAMIVDYNKLNMEST